MMPRNPSYLPMAMRRPQPMKMHPGYFRAMYGEAPSFLPHFGRPVPMRQSQGGGGLLAKLLNKGNQSRGIRSLNPLGGMGVQNAGRGASILQTLTNPSSINGFLTNTQKVLNTAQQIGPIIQQVQQYGPIMKNLPTMWRLYKGLKNMPNTANEDDNNSSFENNQKENTDEIKQHSNLSAIHHEPSKVSQKAESRVALTSSKWKEPLPSAPKLYI
nr:VrrA/YqfQ family protein [uncultured Bacillus sp.]